LTELDVPLKYVDLKKLNDSITSIIKITRNTVLFDLGKGQFEFTFEIEKEANKTDSSNSDSAKPE